MRPIVRTTLGVAIFIDVLRVFLPSLITIYGQAGGTPSERIGEYALAWFLGAFVAVGVGGVIGARYLGLAAAGLLIVGRLSLQFTDGGAPQLVIASVTLLAGLAWLTATAMSTRDMRPIVLGVAWGFAVATGLHAALDTIDLVWRTGRMPLVVLGVELVVFLAMLDARVVFSAVAGAAGDTRRAVAARRIGRSGGGPADGPPPPLPASDDRGRGDGGGADGRDGDGGGPGLEELAVAVRTRSAPPRLAPVPISGAPRAWLAIGPAFLLWGMYTGSTAHAQASAGWPAVAGAVVVVVGCFVATAVAANPGSRPAVPAVALVASSVAFAFGAGTVGGVHGVAPWWTVVAQVVGAFGLAGCLGWVARTGARDNDDARPAPRAHPYRQGLALAAGFLLFVILAFAYYAASDLGIPNDYVPILAAAVVAAVALGRPTGATDTGPGPWLAGFGGAVVVTFAVAFIPLWTPPVTAAPPPAAGLRIAAYNIRMGFGLRGTFTLAQQAEALRQLHPHIVVLSEVDRGWFLNGGHDDLRLIAERLGLQYVWAPAADEVWGDALLTNLPIKSVINHVLVHGGPTGAQALEVRLKWNDQVITVIATHLQPPADWQPLDQVRQLADIVRAAATPTIVAGDLNLEPGGPAWNVLADAGLSDAFAGQRPFDTIPSPGDAEQIDHILVKEGPTLDAAPVDPSHPDLPYSDHRPIAVTLVPAPTTRR